MDFNMPEPNGLHASRAILRNCPDAPILLLTIFASPSWQSKPNDTVGIAQEMILVGRQKVKQPSS
jgi:CheY-like chemotaxis protein